MSNEQEMNELVVSNEQALAEFDLSELSAELGTPFSDTDILEASPFLQERPKLLNVLKVLQDHSIAKRACQYIDTANYTMIGDDRFKPLSARIIKKMDPAQPLFQIGSFRVGEHPTPSKEFKFYPLFLYRTRVYFPPYEGEASRAICSSTNNWQGVCNQPSTHIRECNSCPFKEWGVQKDGTIDINARTKPLCRPQVCVVGVTPDFDGLYEIILNTYCLVQKSFNAPSKFITGARMNTSKIDPQKLGIDPSEAMNYQANFSTLDQVSTWLKVSGQPVEVKNRIVSAGTVVENTEEYLTKEQAIYMMMYKQLAEDYYYYLMNNFVNYMDSSMARMRSESASDTISTESKIIESIDDADVMDSIDVDD